MSFTVEMKEPQKPRVLGTDQKTWPYAGVWRVDSVSVAATERDSVPRRRGDAGMTSDETQARKTGDGDT